MARHYAIAAVMFAPLVAWAILQDPLPASEEREPNGRWTDCGMSSMAGWKHDSFGFVELTGVVDKAGPGAVSFTREDCPRCVGIECRWAADGLGDAPALQPGDLVVLRGHHYGRATEGQDVILSDCRLLCVNHPIRSYDCSSLSRWNHGLRWP